MERGRDAQDVAETTGPSTATAVTADVKQSRGRAVALALCLLGVALVASALLGARAAGQDGDRTLDRTVRYLQQSQHRDGCFPMKPGGPSDPTLASSWAAIALAAAGVNPREQFRADGKRSVYQCLERSVDGFRVTTDYERVLLVVNAAGTDPRDFGGVDLVGEVLAQQQPDGGFVHDPADGAVGVNTTIWAVLSLAPLRDARTRAAVRRAAEWIVAAQNADGSWPATAVGAGGDADTTGAALQALRAAGLLGGTTPDPSAVAARDRTLAWLRGLQGEDGGFPAIEGAPANSASTAWVAQGLWAVGADPGKWRNGGRSALEFLRSLQRADGSIVWTAERDLNPVWMTAYAGPAYSGRYLPLARVAYTGRVPGRDQPPVPGEGGAGGGRDGALAGGGGRGAPNFSRPQAGSKGRTVGGVRDTTAVPGRPAGRPRTQAQQDANPLASPAPATSAPTPVPSTATPSPSTSDAGGLSAAEEPDDADPGAPSTPAADRPPAPAPGDDDAAAGAGDRDELAAVPADVAGDGSREISGVVVGGGTKDGDDDLGAAFGLSGSERGAEQGPWIALGLVGALLLAAGIGGLFERRRTHFDPRV